MAQYIFEIDGNYVNFNGGGGLWRLARASNCIAWRFDETGDLFFDVYDQQYVVKAENIAQVVIDGVPLAAASDFPTAIMAVFTGLGGAGGGVESVTAGDASISVGGTATNPTVKLPYLVYVPSIMQSGTSNPTATALEDTIGGTWARTAEGNYTYVWSVSYSSYNEWIAPFGPFLGNATVYLPISSGSAIVGYYTIYRSSDVDITMSVINNSFAAADLSALLGNNKAIFLPELRLYAP